MLLRAFCVRLNENFHFNLNFLSKGSPIISASASNPGCFEENEYFTKVKERV
jgi:hypothetical protein